MDRGTIPRSLSEGRNGMEDWHMFLGLIIAGITIIGFTGVALVTLLVAVLTKPEGGKA